MFKLIQVLGNSEKRREYDGLSGGGGGRNQQTYQTDYDGHVHREWEYTSYQSKEYSRYYTGQQQPGDEEYAKYEKQWDKEDRRQEKRHGQNKRQKRQRENDRDGQFSEDWENYERLTNLEKDLNKIFKLKRDLKKLNRDFDRIIHRSPDVSSLSKEGRSVKALVKDFHKLSGNIKELSGTVQFFFEFIQKMVKKK